LEGEYPDEAYSRTLKKGFRSEAKSFSNPTICRFFEKAQVAAALEVDKFEA
jgi:hypothetical protein